MTTLPETLRVLILEDDDDDALLAALTLEQEGTAVDWRRVETGAALVEALDGFAPEVVLADHSMPRLTAWQALEVATAHPSRVPLIVVSGTIGEETAVDLLRAGASNFVAKQHLERLVPAVGQALTELRLRRDREAAETTLARSERRHRAFVTASSLFTWRFTPEAGLVAVDGAWLELVGMTAAQACGDGWLAAVHADDRPHCRDAWERARREIAAFE